MKITTKTTKSELTEEIHRINQEVDSWASLAIKHEDQATSMTEQYRSMHAQAVKYREAKDQAEAQVQVLKELVVELARGQGDE